MVGCDILVCPDCGAAAKESYLWLFVRLDVEQEAHSDRALRQLCHDYVDSGEAAERGEMGDFVVVVSDRPYGSGFKLVQSEEHLRPAVL